MLARLTQICPQLGDGSIEAEVRIPVSEENQTSAASSVTAGVEKSSSGIYQSHRLWGYVNVPLAFLPCLG